MSKCDLAAGRVSLIRLHRQYRRDGHGAERSGSPARLSLGNASSRSLLYTSSNGVGVSESLVSWFGAECCRVKRAVGTFSFVGVLVAADYHIGMSVLARTRDWPAFSD